MKYATVVTIRKTTDFNGYGYRKWDYIEYSNGKNIRVINLYGDLEVVEKLSYLLLLGFQFITAEKDFYLLTKVYEVDNFGNER